MSFDERPCGSARPTRKRHYNLLPRTCLEGALDAAYDSKEVREELETRSYVPHIRSADKDKEEERKRHLGGRARRWVVERTHSWLNRSRRLLVRWEKKTENYLGFIHLACAQLIFSKILVSG